MSRALRGGQTFGFLAAGAPVLSYSGLYGGEPQRGVPRTRTDNFSTQRIDELLVVHFEDFIHAEAIVQNALYHYRGGPHAYGVSLAGPRKGLYFAVTIALQVYDDGPPAFGAASGHDDVSIFESPLVPGALEVLYEHGYAALAVQASHLVRPLALDGGANQVAPLGPGTVVVAHVVVA